MLDCRRYRTTCAGVATAFLWVAAGLGQDAGPHPRGLSILDAVRSAVANHPAILEQRQQIEITRGMQMQAAGQFDTSVGGSLSQSRVNTPLTRLEQLQALSGGVDTSALISDVTAPSVEGSRQLRNGIALSGAFTLGRLADNLTNLTGTNTSHLGVQLSAPLMRGRGREVTTAQERAATIEVAAAEYDGSHVVEQLIANAASSYWSVVAARKALAVAGDAEGRGRSYVENVSAFIEADRVPRSDLNNVTANLADRAATRIAAEQNVVAARVQLALNMGLASGDIDRLEDPVDDFPASPDKLPPTDSGAAVYYLRQALENRPDYLAAQRRYAESQVVLRVAQDNLRPYLGFSVGAGYSGMREGHGIDQNLYSAVAGVRGVDFAIGLTYRLAPARTAARGQLLQAQASAKQAQLRIDDIKRNIEAAIVVSVGGLRHAALQVRQTADSVSASRAALDGEREKYRLGTASVVDILTVEDRLTGALLSRIQADQTYAVALVQFRLATGTFLGPNAQPRVLDSNVLFEAPFADVPGQTTVR